MPIKKSLNDPIPVYHTIGTNAVMGTDWPIENKLEVVRHPSTLKITGYMVTYRISNGTASGSEVFKRKRDAEAALYGDGTD